MELTYTCEKSEKESLELAMRPFKRYFRTLFIYAAVLFLAAAAFAVARLMCAGIVVDSSADYAVIYFALALALTAFGWSLRHRFRRGIVETYRCRKTSLSEYRLTDDALFCAHGESKATLPWSDFKRYRIDDDALYLQSRNGTVACIPDWSGHGAERAELAAVLEKAGLKRMDASKARRIAAGVFWAALCCLAVFLAIMRLHDAWPWLKREIVGAELKRLLIEYVGGPEKDGNNPYSNYWHKRGNAVQRVIAEAYSFKPEKFDYIFDGEAEHDKVGLAATIGDAVWYVYLPCGCVGNNTLEKFEKLKECGAFGECYSESERDKWLEKIRPLARELRDAIDDEDEQ